MQVLLIGIGGAAELDLLMDAIETRGHNPILIDVHDWPGDSRLTLTPGSDTAFFGEEIDLSDVSGVYIVPHHLFHPFESRIRDRLLADFDAALNQVREYRAMFEGLSGILECSSANVVTPLRNHYFQDRKPKQLEMLSQAGLPVPDTVFTTDPDVVRSFVETHDRVVYKPVTRGGNPHSLTEDDLTSDRLAQLKTAPVQFQAFAPGDDVRVFVLDDEVIGAMKYECEAFSFKLDDNSSIRCESVQISDSITESLVQATNQVGLTFAGIDIRLQPNGEYHLIELNEVPKFGAAEKETSLPISSSLADYLTGPKN